MMIATVALFLSLGLDTLAVAIGLGVGGLPLSRWLRVGLTFALFEGVMPIVGLLAGQHLSGVLGEIAAYLSAIALIVLGGLEIREALSPDGEAESAAERLAEHDRSIFATGLAVSLDELAVGFSLGVLHVALGPALLYIALQAFALTFAGLALGSRIGARLGERAELAAGVILALLGVALLVSEATGTHFV
jgi:putative Mn2+ efflux pump MntP